MESQKISINEPFNKYGLIPYADGYERLLLAANLSGRIRILMELYAQRHEKFPSMQSYMLVKKIDGNDEFACVGGITIAPSTLYRDYLALNIELSELHFSDTEKMEALIETIIKTISMYYYSYKGLSVHINYRGLYLGMKRDFLFEDSRYHDIYPKIVEEMDGAEEILTFWGMTWLQDLHERRNSYEVFLFDKELYERKKAVPNAEVFNKHDYVNWHISSKNSDKCITFNSDGQIQFEKIASKKGSDYKFSYNVLSDDLEMQLTGKNNYVIKLVGDDKYFEHGCTTFSSNLSSGQLTIAFPISNNSSLELVVNLTPDGRVVSCGIDFYTYKGKEKMKRNGAYAFRANSSGLSFNFLSRGGLHACILKSNEYKNLQEKLATILNEPYSAFLLEDLISDLVSYINNWALQVHREQFVVDEAWNLHDALNIKDLAIRYLKEIKGEIPLPHLCRILDTCIAQFETRKESNRLVRVKKEEE